MKNIAKALLISISFTNLATSNVISVSDFILDYNRIKGKNVCVKGDIMAMGDMTTLSDPSNSMTSISIDTKKLPRDVRKSIMQKCGIMSECKKTVCGKVADMDFDKGLIATKIK